MRPRSLALIGAAAVLAVAVAAVAYGGRGDEVRPAPPAPATESGGAHTFDVQRIAQGLNRPTFVGAAPGDPDALWVLEQPGRVVRLHGAERTVVLNRRLYLHWSDRDGDTRVGEFRLPAAEPVRLLLFVDQPEENHNGGQLAFGPDGRLYLGLGDGGGAFDPRRAAQDPEQKLGKLLSVDVGAPRPDWRVELLGLRNPWRFAFDLALGEVWIGDVGQDRIEEVNRVLLEPDEPPKNLGWSAYEGTARVSEGDERLAAGEIVWPVAAYSHEDTGGCSVTGGYVYRGTALPGLQGRYLYGDFCLGALWSLKGTPAGRATDVRREAAQVPQVTHIGPDADGEPVLAAADGAIYRAIPRD
jgi:glucose/arabinose dehydrogenase